jgi:hypothetical protein
MRAHPYAQRDSRGSRGTRTISRGALTSRRTVIALLGVVATCCGAFACAADLYTITRLPIPSGASYVIPAGINDSGQVTGYYGSGNGTDKAFIWSASAGYEVILSPSAGAGASGASINSSGHVVAERGQDGFVWRGPNDVTLLEKSGYAYGKGLALSDSGDVSGYVGALGAAYPVIWDSSNNPTYITAGREGQALAVNSSRVTVGFVDRFESKGFVWSDATGLQLLPALPSYARSYPYAINNSNAIVGSSDLNVGGSADSRSFLWTESNGIEDLGSGAAVDINDLNVVVGRQGNAAFMWDAVNGRRDLNSLGDFGAWNLTKAIGINNRGQIVGRGEYQSLLAAFVLTPVPEPTNFVTVAAALAFGYWNALRRNREGVRRGGGNLVPKNRRPSVPARSRR